MFAEAWGDNRSWENSKTMIVKVTLLGVRDEMCYTCWQQSAFSLTRRWKAWWLPKKKSREKWKFFTSSSMLKSSSNRKVSFTKSIWLKCQIWNSSSNVDVTCKGNFKLPLPTDYPFQPNTQNSQKKAEKSLFQRNENQNPEKLPFILRMTNILLAATNAAQKDTLMYTHTRQCINFTRRLIRTQNWASKKVTGNIFHPQTMSARKLIDKYINNWTNWCQ